MELLATDESGCLAGTTALAAAGVSVPASFPSPAGVCFFLLRCRFSQICAFCCYFNRRIVSLFLSPRSVICLAHRQTEVG